MPAGSWLLNGPFDFRPGEVIITTERLTLSAPSRADLGGLIKVVSDKKTNRFLGSMRGDPADQFARLLRNAGSWALYGYGTFTLRERGDPSGEIIGNCGVFHSYRGYGEDFDDQPEAGWIIRSDHWSRGYAGEAMRAALEWFDVNHGDQRTVAMIDMENAQSHRLAQKLGFKPYRLHELVSEANGGELGEEGLTLQCYERLP